MMVFVDPKWPKTGRLSLPDEFVWPDLYKHSLKERGKIFVYRYGESEPYRELFEGEDLGGAQPIGIYYSGALVTQYLKLLRAQGLYNKPEVVKKKPATISRSEEMSYAGVYGDAWAYYRSQIEEEKENAIIATKNTIQNFVDELACPDTGLQLYMGIAKAQLEKGEVLPEIQKETLRRMEEENDYLLNEKWLMEQADEIKSGLLNKE